MAIRWLKLGAVRVAPSSIQSAAGFGQELIYIVAALELRGVSTFFGSVISLKESEITREEMTG